MQSIAGSERSHPNDAEAAERAVIDVNTHLAKTREVIANSVARLVKARTRFLQHPEEFFGDIAAPIGGGDNDRSLDGARLPKLGTSSADDAGASAIDESRLFDMLTVEVEAHRLIRRQGSAAIRLARASADAADANGDMLSAEAWRDIADEAERILGHS